MTAELAVLEHRRVTVCCASHTPGGLGWCCDISDCAPCCPECPTCVQCMSTESSHPGWRAAAAEEQRRWQSEYWGDRRALASIASALWWFDRSDWRRTVIEPPMVLIVRTSRAVTRAIWDQVF